MRKHIIALKGRGNQGKTTTLRLLYERLIASDFQKLHFWETKDRHGLPKDLGAILTYQDLKIGITTLGDNREQIEKQWDWFHRQQCTLMIFACRTRGAGTNFLKEQRADGWSLEFKDKTIASTPNQHRPVNENDANDLLSKVLAFFNTSPL